MVTYWILGEGEQHHGAHVISFRLRSVALIAKRSATGGDGRERHDAPLRVVSVERKLPAADPTIPRHASV
jgi:hypothetical protein